jgi:signal transduction histidine kinase
VLAHTLSALSIRLEALDSVLGDAAGAAVRDELEATKRLVREGLGEARGAVRALRDDVDSLESELARLAAERHASLSITGTPRPIRPEVALVLYRVAQEALTNALKHAPGAPVEVHLGFDEGVLRLCVRNGAGAAPSPLAQSGAGYGLHGIHERVLLVGGTVEAGPADSGWLVAAEVPA